MENKDKIFNIIEYIIIGVCLVMCGVLLITVGGSRAKRKEVKTEYVTSQKYDQSLVQKVNINTAGVEELTALDSIGESKAQNIIKYRETNGSFKSVKDIMKVDGIGKGIFNKIKDRISV